MLKKGLLIVGLLWQLAAVAGGLKLDHTRLSISDSESATATLIVTNNSNKTWLIQSRVLKSLAEINVSTRNRETEFFVQPPIVKLASGQAQTLRIIRIKPHSSPDREIMDYVYVKAIPSSSPVNFSTGEQENNHISVSLGMVVKLIAAPHGLSVSPDAAASGIIFKNVNGMIEVSNDSPRYISFSYLNINGVMADWRKNDRTIAPFNKTKINMSFHKSARNKATWTVINTLGGDSKSYSTTW